jgi:hypothetical protein
MQAPDQWLLHMLDVDARCLCSHPYRLVRWLLMMTSQHPLEFHLLQGVATDRSLLATVAALAMPRISETIFLTLLILSECHPMARKATGNRNTRLPSSVLSALSGSPEHTTYVLISEHTRVSDRSFARSAVKHSLTNTTASVTKVCILARRNPCVVALFRVVRAGAVVADSPAQMPWVDTSGRRLVVFALKPC